MIHLSLDVYQKGMNRNTGVMTSDSEFSHFQFNTNKTKEKVANIRRCPRLR